MKKSLSAAIALSLGLLPAIVSAQTTLINPIGITDPRLIIARVIQGALSLSGSIALLMFVYGGFLWMTAMGKPAQVQKGKDIFTWAILGIIMIASSYVVVTAIFRAVLTGSAGA